MILDWVNKLSNPPLGTNKLLNVSNVQFVGSKVVIPITSNFMSSKSILDFVFEKLILAGVLKSLPVPPRELLDFAFSILEPSIDMPK